MIDNPTSAGGCAMSEASRVFTATSLKSVATDHSIDSPACRMRAASRAQRNSIASMRCTFHDLDVLKKSRPNHRRPRSVRIVFHLHAGKLIKSGQNVESIIQLRLIKDRKELRGLSSRTECSQPRWPVDCPCFMLAACGVRRLPFVHTGGASIPNHRFACLQKTEHFASTIGANSEKHRNRFEAG
jgi:hypothetical protein